MFDCKNDRIFTIQQYVTGAFGISKVEKTVPYGVHPMFQGVAKQQVPAPATLTPLSDRVSNAEATVLAFTAENSLSFSLVPGLIELAKSLACDKKSLDGLGMNRTTASYKTKFGVGKTFRDELVKVMKVTKFSLNMDESTSSNYQKVLTVLVSYFCCEKKQVVVKHFASVSCIKVNSLSLYDEIVNLMESNNIPWTNLMSILMDSCNVMRGCKSGLETRIRTEKAPHLLDIDGDVCHHVHNAAKSFCKVFGYCVEQLYNDVFNDFKWSADLRELLQEICCMLNIKYTMPQRYVSHRWLSVYDVALDTLRLFDCLTVFYFAWLPESEKCKFLPAVVEVYHRLRVSQISRERITAIRQVCISRRV